MKIKIKMTKRLMVVICIIVAALSFMGGMVYKYEDVINIVEHDPEKSKFTYEFKFPVGLETADFWLDWAINFHQYWIDTYIDTKEARENRMLEKHYGYIDMYSEIKVLFQEFEEEYYIK